MSRHIRARPTFGSDSRQQDLQIAHRALLRVVAARIGIQTRRGVPASCR